MTDVRHTPGSVEETASLTGIRLFAGAAKWATIAANYANGKDAVAARETPMGVEALAHSSSYGLRTPPTGPARR